MPDKPLTVFTYAASASLAAVALVYFFHPNYLFDGDSSFLSSASSRKKGIVGLYNPANDCFINCILQSLAGLGDLRIYLIRECHRRELGGADVYEYVPEKDPQGKEVNYNAVLSLQRGEVTKGLKDIIDRLNERPIYKKTISAVAFIRVLERAFHTSISKAQQDAQELLQLVAERLSEEYHAGRAARKRFRESHQKGLEDSNGEQKLIAQGDSAETPQEESREKEEADDEDEEGFPLEGKTEARVECEYCHFVPKPTPTSFVMLNLMVPQRSSCTLTDCFDAHFKTEYIEDYKCDKCRLIHAIQTLTKELDRAVNETDRSKLRRDIRALEKAIAEDPETPPKDVQLPDIKLAPKRKIARHIEITEFPKVLVIHLSRSIFDSRSASTKNTAKVTFPEKLPVGGILHRRQYKLLGVVTHKGTHNSGHYETFRRQHQYPPISNPLSDVALGPYAAPISISSQSPPNVNASPSPSPNAKPMPLASTLLTSDKAASSRSSPSVSSKHTSDLSRQSLPSTQPSSHSEDTNPNTSKPNPSSTPDPAPSSSKPQASGSTSALDFPKLKSRRRRTPAGDKGSTDRWWRISDDKVRECKTGDVLGMRGEVYLLFFER